MTNRTEIPDGAGFVFERITQDSGRFRLAGDDAAAVASEFDGLLERRDAGRLSESRFLSSVQDLLAGKPWFAPAGAHLAFMYFEQGRADKALDVALQALDRLNALVPRDFDGMIGWEGEENQIFLRLQHIVALCHIRLRKHCDAVEVLQRLLRHCPEDSLGVRLLLGPEHLRCGSVAEARGSLQPYQELHPSYSYELGLSFLMEQDWVRAATALRKGFAANPYVAEILCGNPDPQALAVWHANLYEQPEAAKDYLDAYADLWHDTENSQRFLHWLFHHPAVLEERAGILACKEALRWERDGKARAQWLQKLEQRLEAIDDGLSERVVVQHTDMDGRRGYPWELRLRF
ncbi:tetratricopeptide repeat protein [Paracandidimonas soli]|uniref:Tetratricopeptide repeat protein n=1 Tax=Paracandidimonas soli TaxID=1917182 RepID=A0A4V2VSC9_9BURK|nr:tetratricopeptide repeat protein [Paracandidimonas soli]TCV01860.1 hypothetical protein EV686_102575 [Paracandidimonas soli]